MGLQTNVAGLLKDALGAKRTHSYEGPWTADGAPQSQVDVSVQLTRTDRGIWVFGAAKVSYDAECARCLVPFTSWVDTEVDEEYLPSIDIASGGRIRYEEQDEDSFRIDEHHEIDLTEAMRQYTLAAMPLAPVCGEDCRGLCARCGTSLNENACACEREPDPRLAPLRELLA